jgi:hypothetical protein
MAELAAPTRINQIWVADITYLRLLAALFTWPP